MTTLRDLYGTDEPPAPRRALSAGPLSAVLEGGQLRDIRWHGILALRGIAYLLRDANWGTMAVALRGLAVEEGPSGFAVAYEAEGPGLSLAARIEGRASGRLRFAVAARARRDVVTNRTGFVVLHPDTAAGGRLRVTHADGTAEDTAFPGRIRPDQPAFDIAALSHDPAPGLTAVCAFEGGVFEMEDQRNWADASFKTYVRPLAWPRPYTMPAGAEDRQAVTLTLSGRPARIPPRGGTEAAGGTMPPLWVRLDPAGPVPAALCLPGLAQGVILRATGALPDPGRLAAAARLARAGGMRLGVEVVLPARDPVAEARALARALAGAAPDLVLAGLARDLTSRPANTVPPGEASAEAVALALRAALPGATVAMGTQAFFTEFNRNPPAPGGPVFFGVAATVHAADDAAVMETVGVLPEIARSAAALCSGGPLLPGPLTIAPTVSPYAPALAASDGTTRTCMAARDPRHGALFGAAHLAGVAAALAPHVAGLAPAFASGDTGLARADGTPLPLAHVHAALAAAAGRALVAARVDDGLATLAWDGGRLIANLGDGPRAIPAGQGARDLRPEGWRPAAGPLGPCGCRLVAAS